MNPDSSAALFDDSEVVPLFTGHPAVEKVFSNPLIWKTIGSYLNVGDLKACRLVNSRFHAMVMKEANFPNRCLVSLKPHQITRNIFGSTSVPWKNVLLKFGDLGPFSINELDWLYPVISNVESLSLRVETGWCLLPILIRLLNAPGELRALAMEPMFITYETRQTFHACEDALKNLQEFEILQRPSGWPNDIMDWENLKHWFNIVLFLGERGKIRVVKSYFPLKIDFIDPDDLLAVMDAQVRLHFQEEPMLTVLLESIATSHANTLKHAAFSDRGHCNEGAVNLKNLVQSHSFPSLESATFYLTQCQTVWECLLTLPILKELDLTLRSVSTALSISVLNAVEERSACLRKLRIRSRVFTNTGWQFLKETKIEEFQLEFYNSDREEEETLPDEALNCLPSTVRRLFVRGPLQSNPILALGRLNPSLVTQLTFINSGDSFTDDTMKYIRENFHMLRKLNVTNAKRVTDAGFVGPSPESSSFSMIKGLRTLILRGCEPITDATLREIRFLELRYLDLSYNTKLTKNGYEGVLLNNPSLESLLMSCKNFYRKKELLCESHPRLSSVAYRNLKP